MFDLRLGGNLGYRILRAMSRPPESEAIERVAERDIEDRSDRAATHFGSDIHDDWVGKTVLDFGAGEGNEAVDIALRGAEHVYGIDVNDEYLDVSRARAVHHGVADKCTFLHPVRDAGRIVELEGRIERLFSLDAFEHFDDPRAVLVQMLRLLSPEGKGYVSFGPPWWHPWGSHMQFFARVPWMQAWFTEKTILNVRAIYRNDGCQTFREAGVNQMTVARFLSLLDDVDANVEDLQVVPIRKTEWIPRVGPIREIFTSVVRCRFSKRGLP